MTGRGHAPGGPPGPPNVVLIGFTGAGKTTVGALVAQRLRRPHLDVDAVFESRLGPIPAFVARRGVLAFRTAERAVLRECLPRRGAVVSAGAGSVRPPATRRLLCHDAQVFFLDVPADVLAARLAAVPRDRLHRPDLVAGDAAAAIAAELASRRALYAQVGRRVDGTPPPAEVAAEVVRLAAAVAAGA